MSLKSVPEITPLELARSLESGEHVQILDIRAQSGVANPAAGLLPGDRIMKISGSRLLRFSTLGEAAIDPSTPVVVICAHGNDSKIAASFLNRLGAAARSLKGGMAAWMKLTIPRVLDAPPGIDHLIQFDRVGKEALSYVMISAGKAVIIDPPREPRAHLQFVEESQATLVAVADTHVHADYISGAPQIARDRRIPYYLHPADGVSPYDGTPGRLDIEPVSDGMSIRVGDVSLTAFHTPGHSPGSVTYLAGGHSAFTGDFLFITSIGRPDLADKSEEWSALLWKSVQRAKSAWPPEIMIYPAHYMSQTPRGKNSAIGDSFAALLGRNPSLGITDESEFLKWIRTNASTPPPAYRSIKGINIGLLTVEEPEADFLETGRNECAVGGV